MQVGQVLGGRYRLVEPLGSGGTAVVWHAHDEVLGRAVAVKLLADRHLGDSDSRRQIRSEARAAAALSHPNIAQVHDYGLSEDGVPYVVMELIRGGTLQHRLAAGPLPPRYAMRVAAEVFAALAAAHADGLVHRDIKPGNVMVTPSGVKVVDFGIAAAIRPGRSPEDEFEVLGTPAYVAPERLIDDAVEPASDVYSVGVLLYRMLTGTSPWNVDTTTQVLAAHVSTEPLPLPPIPGVPGFIAELCDRCLSKDPTMRPSAREAATLLAQGAGLRVVEDEPVTEPAPATADSEPSVLIRKEARHVAVAPAIYTADPSPATAGSAATPETARDGVVETTGRTGRRRRLWLIGATVAAALVALVWMLLPVGKSGGQAAGPTPTGAASQPPGHPVDSPGGSVSPSASTGVPGTTPGGPAPLPGKGVTGRGATSRAATTGPRTAGPTATDPGPTVPKTMDPPADPQARTLSSDAGSVTAICPSAGLADLLSWSAVKPFKVQLVDAGPGAAPSVVFKHGNTLVQMTVTCSGGKPSITTTTT